jgi:hypothetical protein
MVEAQSGAGPVISTERFCNKKGPKSSVESGCCRSSSTCGLPSLGRHGAWLLYVIYLHGELWKEFGGFHMATWSVSELFCLSSIQIYV